MVKHLRSIVAGALSSVLISCSLIKDMDNPQRGNYMGTDGLLVQYNPFFERYGYTLLDNFSIDQLNTTPMVVRKQEKSFYEFIFENYDNIPDKTVFIVAPGKNLFFSTPDKCQTREIEDHIIKHIENIEYVTIHHETLNNVCEHIKEDISLRMKRFFDASKHGSLNIIDVHLFDNAILKYTPHPKQFTHKKVRRKYQESEQRYLTSKLNYTTTMIGAFIDEAKHTEFTNTLHHNLFSIRSEPLYKK